MRFKDRYPAPGHNPDYLHPPLGRVHRKGRGRGPSRKLVVQKVHGVRCVYVRVVVDIGCILACGLGPALRKLQR